MSGTLIVLVKKTKSTFLGNVREYRLFEVRKNIAPFAGAPEIWILSILLTSTNKYGRRVGPVVTCSTASASSSNSTATLPLTAFDLRIMGLCLTSALALSP
jgi:hypothetical protein